MTPEQTAFGMTLEEVGRLKKSVIEWTDGNHPMVSKSDGGDFASAFRRGAELLRADPTFAHIFQMEWPEE